LDEPTRTGWRGTIPLPPRPSRPRGATPHLGRDEAGRCRVRPASPNPPGAASASVADHWLIVTSFSRSPGGLIVRRSWKAPLTVVVIHPISSTGPARGTPHPAARSKRGPPARNPPDAGAGRPLESQVCNFAVTSATCRIEDRPTSAAGGRALTSASRTTIRSASPTAASGTLSILPMTSARPPSGWTTSTSMRSPGRIE
jgi:hypothetical protein